MNRRGMEWSFVLGAAVFLLLLVVIIYLVNTYIIKPTNASANPVECETQLGDIKGTCKSVCASGEFQVKNSLTKCPDEKKYCCYTMEETTANNEDGTPPSS